MNPLVEFLAGGGGLGYRQRKQKEDQEAEMARLFKEQQMKTAKIQQQAAELQLQKEQQGPQPSFGKAYQGPQGKWWQDQMGEGNRITGRVELPPGYAGPVTPKKYHKDALEASIYLPDGIEWADATRAQKQEALKMMGAGKKEPNDPSGLRKEYRSVTNDFSKVNDAWARIVASAEDPSAAGDLALIFNYMKVLDPGSTVREGEFATAQNSAGVPARIQAKYNEVVRGERLAPEQRADFVSRGQKLYEKALDGYDQTVAEFQRLSGIGGYNPEMVIFDRATARGYNIAPPQESPPTAAASVDEFDFSDLSEDERQELLILLEGMSPEMRQSFLARFQQ